MKKALALDLGDKWTGIAISDILKMFARPYKTFSTRDIEKTLSTIFSEEPIDTVVVGYPKTMKGNESDQTKKVVTQHDALKEKFPTITWILWDERLSSKRADAVRAQKGKKKEKPEEKLQSHAIAAAFILDSYLTSRTFCNN